MLSNGAVKRSAASPGNSQAAPANGRDDVAYAADPARPGKTPSAHSSHNTPGRAQGSANALRRPSAYPARNIAKTNGPCTNKTMNQTLVVNSWMCCATVEPMSPR
ncbi:hypothetical protein D3C87_1748930 [compost metagenome]